MPVPVVLHLLILHVRLPAPLERSARHISQRYTLDQECCFIVRAVSRAPVVGHFLGVVGRLFGGGAALSSYTARLAFCFAIDHQHQRHQAAVVAAVTPDSFR